MGMAEDSEAREWHLLHFVPAVDLALRAVLMFCATTRPVYHPLVAVTPGLLRKTIVHSDTLERGQRLCSAGRIHSKFRACAHCTL